MALFGLFSTSGGGDKRQCSRDLLYTEGVVNRGQPPLGAVLTGPRLHLAVSLGVLASLAAAREFIFIKE